MKVFLNSLKYLTIAFLFLTGGMLKAQTSVIQSWGFESGLFGWSNTEGASLQLSTVHAKAGSNSAILIKPATGLTLTFQNDTFKDLKEDDIFQVSVWISKADLASVSSFQIFWQTGSTWKWSSISVPAKNLVGDAWNNIVKQLSAVDDVVQSFGVQLVLKAGSETKMPTMFIDEIVLSRSASGSFVTQWGFVDGRVGGWALTSGNPGSISMGGSSAIVSGQWAAVRGGFDPIKPVVGSAVVITGQVEFVGAGFDAWSNIRYGVFNNTLATTLTGAGTSSASWGSVGGNSYGYQFFPISGVNSVTNFNTGGNGTQGVVRNGNWISTSGSYTLGTIEQKPNRAVATAGTYNFAFSVAPQADGSNEIRFYLIKDDNSYWFGGTVKDPAALNTTFNGFCFGIQNAGSSPNPDLRGVNFKSVKARLGDPIAVPDAPWTSYYLSQWGFYGTNNGGWNFETGEYVGNATISGTAAPSAWTILRGGFADKVEPTTTRALKVTGKIKFTGAIDTWSALRYGLFYSDSAGVVVDSVVSKSFWNGKNSNANYGYLFVPYSGTNDPINWNAGNPSGNATHGGIVNRPVNSTNNQAQNYILGEFKPKPNRAVLTEGTYDFAISVQPLENGTQELRFYLIKDDKSYYFGGTSIDTTVSRRSTKFNSVCFALNNTCLTVRKMELMDVNVDLGAPIVVPDPPFSPFYVAKWGFTGGRTGGWNLAPFGEFDGDITISGAAALTGWSAIRGEFEEAAKPTTSKAVIVTGKMDFVGGGFQDWSSLRMGLFYSDSAGTLADNKWSGTEAHSNGYLFLPHSDNNELTNWQGISQLATVGAVVDGTWISSNGGSNYVITNKKQKGGAAVGGAGLYDFAFSIGPVKTDGSTEVRYYVHNGTTYQFGGVFTDAHNPLVTDKFNSINIGINNKSTTAVNITEVQVNMGDAIVVPPDVVSVKAIEGLPTEYALLQNYPNPFNPTTTIEFSMPQSGNVKLVVYDILGRVVNELVNGNFNAGNYKVNFNASNLASGIYFYSIKTGDFVSVKKLMLLK